MEFAAKIQKLRAQHHFQISTLILELSFKMSFKAAPLSALPSMPDLDVGEDEDIEMADDHQDENHLLSILQKLKTAKRTLDSSRQK